MVIDNLAIGNTNHPTCVFSNFSLMSYHDNRLSTLMQFIENSHNIVTGV
ncbi:MAG: hypothetical protein AWM53_01563 [Candidatus Dichloromethanomonas elyunquensis]|nr:MAG: hypothetical protein AWM53_01563 [Candidatus Dichloromethanomonas elyunquensis]